MIQDFHLHLCKEDLQVSHTDRIHSSLQNDRYVTTYSEGEEPYRHVVVTLKRNNNQ